MSRQRQTNSFQIEFKPQDRWEAGIAPLTIDPKHVKDYFKDAAVRDRVALVTVLNHYPNVEIRCRLREDCILCLPKLKGKPVTGVFGFPQEGHDSPDVTLTGNVWMSVAVGACGTDPDAQEHVVGGLWWEALKESPEFRAWVAECFPGYWALVKQSIEKEV